MKPSASNFTASGTPRSPTTRCGLAAVRIDPPDLVGAHHRVVEQAVGPDLHGVRHRQVLEQHARRAAVEVELQQPPADPAFVDEQPALVDGDAVGAGHVVAQDPGAGRPPRARSPGRPVTSVAYRSPRASKATSSGATISPPLALIVSSSPVSMSSALIWLPVDLGDVDPAVRSGPQAVRAEEAARRGEPLQAPPLGDGDGRWVASAGKARCCLGHLVELPDIVVEGCRSSLGGGLKLL